MTSLRSIGKRARGTALCAIALFALGSSAAPVLPSAAEPVDDAQRNDLAQPSPNLGDEQYHTELPPLVRPEAAGQDPRIEQVVADQSGIPRTVLNAYRKAEHAVAQSDSSCRLPWELLAAIGKVESGHARGGAVDANGKTRGTILGPVLDGNGFADISDTDGGRWDDDTRYDRAVGPMQFIPSTWQRWAADGNADGQSDPNNIFDAALAAGHYLCAGSRDLGTEAGLRAAVLSYNHSTSYLATVREWLAFYRTSVHPVPDGTGVIPASPGAGNPTSQSTDDYNGDGEPDTHTTDPGGIVIDPPPPSPSLRPGTKPSPSDPSSPSPASPDPTDPSSPDPDPTDTSSPGTDPTDTPAPSTDPSPSDTSTPTADPTDTSTPSTDPSPTDTVTP